MGPQSLGPYRILEPLAQGGMGMIYVALHEPLNRRVALKVLPAHALAEDEDRKRFASEMTLMARLSHPRVVKVLDGGDIDGVPFVAMELLEGKALTGAVERPAHSWTEALAIVGAIAEGLAYLHAEGIVHRDVTPANVMLTGDGGVKLLDFGLARWTESTVLTAHGAVSGTLPFLAPELLNGSPASPASDVWALGCIAYRLITGQPHLTGNSMESWMCAILANPITPPARHVRGLPERVAALVMAMLDRERERRPTAEAVREMASALLADPPARAAAARPPAPTPSAETRRTRLSAFLVAFAFGGVVLVALAAFAPRARPPSPVPVRTATTSPTPEPSASGRDNPDALSAAWSKFSGFAPRLRTGGGTAVRAVAELKARAPIDLGEMPMPWLTWFALGAWLEDQHDEPFQNDASAIDVLALGELLPRNKLKRAAGRSGAELCAVVIASIALSPRDAEHWLTLALMLERENRPRAARRAQRQALMLIGERADLTDAPPFVWRALYTALVDTGDPDADARWWRIAGREAGVSAMGGLAIALCHHPARRARALAAARRLGAPASVAVLVAETGRLLSQVDAGAGRALWREQLALTPGAKVILDALIQYDLLRGREPADGRTAPRFASERAYRLLMPLLSGEAGDGEPLTAAPTPIWLGADCVTLYALRDIDQGQTDRLIATLQAFPDRYLAATGLPRTLVFDLIAHDARATGAHGIGKMGLLHDGPWKLRDAAAGAALTAEGLAFLESALPPVVAARPRDPLPHLTRALARARRGEIGASLAALDEARARTAGYAGEPLEDLALWGAGPPDVTRRTPGQLPQAPVGEVLLRATWSASARDRVPALAAELLERGPVRDLVVAAQAGDGARVLAIATERFEQQPTEPLWSFAIARETARASSPEGWPKRLAMAHRFAGTGTWMLRALARMSIR